jgi:hypothetical protein
MPKLRASSKNIDHSAQDFPGKGLNAVGWYSAHAGGAACDLAFGRGTWPARQKHPNELMLFALSGNLSAARCFALAMNSFSSFVISTQMDIGLPADFGRRAQPFPETGAARSEEQARPRGRPPGI